MKTLVEHLTKIKEHLSDKERWEECRKNNRITGYSSGSLMNDLGGIWAVGDQRQYAPAYDCVVRAITSLFDKPEHGRLKRIELMVNDPVPQDHYRTVYWWHDTATHEDLMKVLDHAIRYARLYVFS